MKDGEIFSTVTDLPADSPWFRLAVASMIANSIIPDGPVKVEAVTSDNNKLLDDEVDHVMRGNLLIQYNTSNDTAAVMFAFPENNNVYVATYLLQQTDQVGQARGGQVIERLKQKVATIDRNGKMIACTEKTEQWH